MRFEILLVVGVAAAATACGDDTSGGTTQGTGATSGGGTSGGTGGDGGAGLQGGAGASGGSPSGGAGGTGGQATGGAGGDGQGGMSTEAALCDACTEPLVDGGGACADLAGTCAQDVACVEWLSCTNDCLDDDWTTTCFDDCAQDHAASAALWQPLVDCICGPCAVECAVVCE